MNTPNANTGLQLRSLVKRSGELELSLKRVPIPTPGDDEVVIRVLATPVNPSDLGLLLGPADLTTARESGTAEEPVLTAKIPERAMAAMAGRLDQSLAVGNEGAGVVVSAGSSPQAQALLGKTVATLSGGMYTQYRCTGAAQCLVLPEGVSPVEGASAFVNPLTALCIIDAMKRDGHTALVHTAAASNLGQMLLRLCLQDGISLINVVRTQAQEELLRGMGGPTCSTPVRLPLPRISPDV
jgi:NADPH2:quinone reductase